MSTKKVKENKLRKQMTFYESRSSAKSSADSWASSGIEVNYKISFILLWIFGHLAVFLRLYLILWDSQTCHNYCPSISYAFGPLPSTYFTPYLSAHASLQSQRLLWDTLLSVPFFGFAKTPHVSPHGLIHRWVNNHQLMINYLLRTQIVTTVFLWIPISKNKT